MNKKKLILAGLFCLLIVVLVVATIHRQSIKSPVAVMQPTQSTVPQPTISSLPNVASNSANNIAQAIVNKKCSSADGLPDPNCTPGAVDPRVTQDNIGTTICKSGYTTTVRPPTSYTTSLKVEQINEYGYTDTNTKDYEEDHLISLELGGSPTDPKNLWPEPGGSPNKKDSVENLCHKEVCNGSIALGEAQKEIATNWHTACNSSVSVPLPTVNEVIPPVPAVVTTIPTTEPANTQVVSSSQDCSTTTALCNDGSCSDAANHQGACSHHGGVSVFYR